MEARLAPTVATARAPSRRSRWTGRILSGVPVLFLVVDGAMKLVHPAVVTEGSLRLGFPDQAAGPLGVILLACVALYLVPWTAVLGAVLLTGYLGGAVAVHVRVEDPLFTHVLSPIYVAILLWGGLYARDPRVRAAVGPRRP